MIIKLKQVTEDGECNFKDIDIASEDIRLSKQCVAEFLETQIGRASCRERV